MHHHLLESRVTTPPAVAASAGRRHERPGPFGPGFRGGPGGPFRAGRMLGDGDLRLIVLALLAEQPRHGYDIIKALEERSHGAYSPSPGVVYPTLTYLEEAGYAAATAEGNKKVYAITDTGRAHLADNRDLADMILVLDGGVRGEDGQGPRLVLPPRGRRDLGHPRRPRRSQRGAARAQGRHRREARRHRGRLSARWRRSSAMRRTQSAPSAGTRRRDRR